MLLNSGKYDFYISGVIKTNKEGQPIKTQKGNGYKKARLDVLDSSGIRHTVYDAVFSKERVGQIVNSIGKKELQDRFAKGKLTLDDLVGECGKCILAVKEGKNGYNDQNVVSVYLKPEANSSFSQNSVEKQEGSGQSSLDSFEPNNEEHDDIPF